MNKKKNNKGFSLIELIIAIAILIILTGLLAPQFMKYIEKSRLAKDMQTLDTVYTSVQGAIADEDAYTALVKIMENDGTKEINSVTGISLDELMGLQSENMAKFTSELSSILGKDAKSVNNSFKSKVAESKNLGQVWVSVDSKMQVVVAFGTAANDPAISDEKDNEGKSTPEITLKVGSNSLIP